MNPMASFPTKPSLLQSLRDGRRHASHEVQVPRRVGATGVELDRRTPYENQRRRRIESLNPGGDRRGPLGSLGKDQRLAESEILPG